MPPPSSDPPSDAVAGGIDDASIAVLSPKEEEKPVSDPIQVYWDAKVAAVARLVPGDHIQRYQSMLGAGGGPTITLADLKKRDGACEGEEKEEGDVFVDPLEAQHGIDDSETIIAKLYVRIAQELITHWRLTHAVLRDEPEGSKEDPSAAGTDALGRKAISLETDSFAYINPQLPLSQFDEVSFCQSLESIEWISAATSPLGTYTIPCGDEGEGEEEEGSSLIDTDSDVFLRAIEGLFIPSKHYEKMRVNPLHLPEVTADFKKMINFHGAALEETRSFACQADVVVAALLLRHTQAPTVMILSTVHDQNHLFEINRRHLHQGMLNNDLRALSSCGPIAYTPDAADLERTAYQAALKKHLRKSYRPFRYLSLRQIPFLYLNNKVKLDEDNVEGDTKKESMGGDNDENGDGVVSPTTATKPSQLSSIDAEYYEAFYREIIAPIGTHYLIEFITSTDNVSVLCDWLCWRHQVALKAAVEKHHSDLPPVLDYKNLLLCSNSMDQTYDRVDKYLMQKALKSAVPSPLPYAQTSRVSSFHEAKMLLTQPPWYGHHPPNPTKPAHNSNGTDNTPPPPNLSEEAVTSVSISNIADDTAESLAALPTTCFPIVAKPANGAGSEFVSLCRSWEELRNAFIVGLGAETVLKKDATVMCLQEYLGGGRKLNSPIPSTATSIERYEASSKELIVDTVTFNGVHFVTDVWYSRKLPLKVKSNRLRSYAVSDVVKKHKNRANNKIAADKKKDTAAEKEEDVSGANTPQAEAATESTAVVSSPPPPAAAFDDVAYGTDGNRREVITTTFVYDYQNLVMPIGTAASAEGDNTGEGAGSYQDVSDEELRIAIEYAQGVATALGMRNGIAHTEIMLTYPDLKTSSTSTSSRRCVPKLIELNPRVQGDIPRGSHVIGCDQFVAVQHLFAFRHELWKARLASSGGDIETSMVWPPVGALASYEVVRKPSSSSSSGDDRVIPPVCVANIPEYFRGHCKGSYCHQPYIVPARCSPITRPVHWKELDLRVLGRALVSYFENLATTPQGSPSLRAMNPAVSSEASAEACLKSQIFLTSPIDWNAHAPRASQPYDPSRVSLHLDGAASPGSASFRTHIFPSYLFNKKRFPATTSPAAAIAPDLLSPMQSYPTPALPVSIPTSSFSSPPNDDEDESTPPDVVTVESPPTDTPVILSYCLKVVFLSSSDDGVLNEHGRIWLRDYLPGFVRFTRGADFVKGPNVRKGYLLSMHKTIDIFSCPAAVVLYGPKDVVEISASIIRLMENTSPATRPLLAAATSAIKDTIANLKDTTSANAGYPIKQTMFTIQSAICDVKKSLWLSQCFPLLGTKPTAFSFLFRVGKYLADNNDDGIDEKDSIGNNLHPYSVPPHHPAAMTMLDFPVTLLAHLVPIVRSLTNVAHPTEAEDTDYDEMALYDEASEASLITGLEVLQQLFGGLVEEGGAAPLTKEIEELLKVVKEAVVKDEVKEEEGGCTGAPPVDPLVVDDGDDTRNPSNMDPSLTASQLLGLATSSSSSIDTTSVRHRLPNALDAIIRANHSHLATILSTPTPAPTPSSMDARVQALLALGGGGGGGPSLSSAASPPASPPPYPLAPSELCASLVLTTSTLISVAVFKRWAESTLEAQIPLFHKPPAGLLEMHFRDAVTPDSPEECLQVSLRQACDNSHNSGSITRFEPLQDSSSSASSYSATCSTLDEDSSDNVTDEVDNEKDEEEASNRILIKSVLESQYPDPRQVPSSWERYHITNMPLVDSIGKPFSELVFRAQAALGDGTVGDGCGYDDIPSSPSSPAASPLLGVCLISPTTPTHSYSLPPTAAPPTHLSATFCAKDLLKQIESGADELEAALTAFREAYMSKVQPLIKPVASYTCTIHLLREIMCLVQMSAINELAPKKRDDENENEDSERKEDHDTAPSLGNPFSVFTRYTASPAFYPHGIQGIMSLTDECAKVAQSVLTSMETLSPVLPEIANLRQACAHLLEVMMREEEALEAGGEVHQDGITVIDDTVNDDGATLDEGKEKRPQRRMRASCIGAELSFVLSAWVRCCSSVRAAMTMWSANLNTLLIVCQRLYDVGVPAYEELKMEVNAIWRRPHSPPPLYLRSDLFGLLRDRSLVKDVVIPAFSFK